MKSYLKRCGPILIAALVACIPGAWGAETLQSVFTRMDQAAAKFKGLKANMRYLSHEAVIETDDVSTGTITVKMPKAHDLHLLIDFKGQDPKQVEIAGTKVQLYLPKSAEVEVYDLGKEHKADLEQFARLSFGSSSKDLLDSYLVKLGGPETIEGQPTTRIELTPKSPDLAVQFPKIELWISDQTGIAVQQKLYQRGKNYSLATYTNEQLNPSIPDSAVKLNLPKGVKINHPQR